jgi:hypothetical protein
MNKSSYIWALGDIAERLKRMLDVLEDKVKKLEDFGR